MNGILGLTKLFLGVILVATLTEASHEARAAPSFLLQHHKREVDKANVHLPRLTKHLQIRTEEAEDSESDDSQDVSEDPDDSEELKQLAKKSPHDVDLDLTEAGGVHYERISRDYLNLMGDDRISRDYANLFGGGLQAHKTAKKNHVASNKAARDLGALLAGKGQIRVSQHLASRSEDKRLKAVRDYPDFDVDMPVEEGGIDYRTSRDYVAGLFDDHKQEKRNGHSKVNMGRVLVNAGGKAKRNKGKENQKKEANREHKFVSRDYLGLFGFPGMMR